jgi:hypothetical protein
VLTEDTDSFIIGDRVWVGGAKPGQIAYIGETQFAPGEWAGVVLDEQAGQYLKQIRFIPYVIIVYMKRSLPVLTHRT